MHVRYYLEHAINYLFKHCISFIIPLHFIKAVIQHNSIKQLKSLLRKITICELNHLFILVSFGFIVSFLVNKLHVGSCTGYGISGHPYWLKYTIVCVWKENCCDWASMNFITVDLLPVFGIVIMKDDRKVMKKHECNFCLLLHLEYYRNRRRFFFIGNVLDTKCSGRSASCRDHVDIVELSYSRSPPKSTWIFWIRHFMNNIAKTHKKWFRVEVIWTWAYRWTL
jgi:hypothetical protein